MYGSNYVRHSLAAECSRTSCRRRARRPRYDGRIRWRCCVVRLRCKSEKIPMPMLCSTPNATFPAQTRSERYCLRMRSVNVVGGTQKTDLLGIQYFHTHKLPNHVLHEDNSGPHFDLQDFTPNHCGQSEVRADRNEDEWPPSRSEKARGNLSIALGTSDLIRSCSQTGSRLFQI